MPGTPRSSTLPRSSKSAARADDQIAHGAGDEDFTGARLAEDARRDVHGEPPDVGVEQLALARMDAHADLDAQCLGVRAQRLCTADGMRRAVERGEVAVAGALDHRAAESFDECRR